MQVIRWGILGTGNIANNMARALHDAPDAGIVAVASRTQERAETFGKKWDIPNCYDSYAALIERSAVDIVYIATPHSEHYANMLLCLDAAKHVLCEKAFTLNAAQARECIARARQQNVFLMEAMWMRFFPAVAQLRTWLQQGIIGDVRLVQADFCINIPFTPEHRLYRPELGGGALLDLGIYPLSFTAMVLGMPQHTQSHAHIGQTGVDELDAMLLTYQNGATASLTCSLRIYKPREAFIIGTHGYIKVHNIFFRPDRLTLHLTGQDAQTQDYSFGGNGYIHEIEEVHACLRAGRTESDIMPLDETAQLMTVMDELRAAWGLVYPTERQRSTT